MSNVVALKREPRKFSKEWNDIQRDRFALAEMVDVGTFADALDEIDRLNEVTEKLRKEEA